MKICPNNICRIPIADQALFCPKCGVKLKVDAAVTTPTAPPSFVPPAPPMRVQSRSSESPQTGSETSRPASAPKDKASKTGSMESKRVGAKPSATKSGLILLSYAILLVLLTYAPTMPSVHPMGYISGLRLSVVGFMLAGLLFGSKRACLVVLMFAVIQVFNQNFSTAWLPGFLLSSLVGVHVIGFLADENSFLKITARPVLRYWIASVVGSTVIINGIRMIYDSLTTTRDLEFLFMIRLGDVPASLISAFAAAVLAVQLKKRISI